MPRFYGINLVGVLVAALAFYTVGFLFYGVVFSREWLLTILQNLDYDGKAINLDQLSTALLQKEWQKAFPGQKLGASIALGIANAFVTTSILAIVLRQLTAHAPGLLASIAWALGLWLGFAVTSVAYDPIYALEPPILFMIDIGHMAIAYVAAAAVLYYFD